MKNSIYLSIFAVMLSACTTGHNQSSGADAISPQVGMANPASQFCVEQGGTLKIQNESNGQVGYCHFKDGKVIEEWTLFRANHSCVPEKAKGLIGQRNLTDEQIKKDTKALQIRRVQPGQPVTMDYRQDRITITIEPSTKNIVQASCG